MSFSFPINAAGISQRKLYSVLGTQYATYAVINSRCKERESTYKMPAHGERESPASSQSGETLDSQNIDVREAQSERIILNKE